MTPVIGGLIVFAVVFIIVGIGRLRGPNLREGDVACYGYTPPNPFAHLT